MRSDPGQTMYEFLVTPSLSISFQRYPYPPTGFVTALPTSCGALPFEAGAPGHLILPSPDGEAFWIGLIPAPAAQPATRRARPAAAS